jgi:hypothetical protein
LNRPVPITITDKSGKAGVAYWLNQNLGLKGEDQIHKRHPAVGKIYKKIEESYEGGRNTSFSHEEMLALAKRYLPELFPSEFEHLKKLAHSIAARITLRLAEDEEFRNLDKKTVDGMMRNFLEKYPFIQFMYLTDPMARNITWQVSHQEDAPKYEKAYPTTDFSDREWYTIPMHTGKLHITDFYRSIYTGKLCLTVSAPVFDDNDEIMAILGGDIRFEELLKIQDTLEEEVRQNTP